MEKTGIAVELIISYKTDRLPINNMHLDKLNGLYCVSGEVLK
jgi:hypothetical protein